MKLFKDEEYLQTLNCDCSSILIGVDEVGRGPLAGPVVSGSVALYFKQPASALTTLKYLREQGIFDSKKLSAKKRQQILQNLQIDVAKIKPDQSYLQLNQADLILLYTVNLQPPKVIDEINILQASLLSMSLATTANLNCLSSFKVLKKIKPTIWVDGNKPINLRDAAEIIPVVKGDQTYLLIALASIIAKEYRDHLMVKLGEKFPNYGFHQHAGYGTKMHIENIKKFGVSSVHRKSFVKNLVNSDVNQHS